MNTSHAVNREDVMAFLDGELTMARAAEIEAHIGGCSECRTLVDTLRQVSGTLNEWAVDAIPDDVRLSENAAPIDTQYGQQGSWWKSRTRFGVSRWVFVAVPAAAVLAIVLVRPPGGFLPSEQRIAAPATSSRGMGGMTPGGGGGRGGGGAGGGRGGAFMGNSPGRGNQGQLGLAAGGAGSPVAAPSEASPGPMIARSVSLSIVTDHFSDARAALERVSVDTGGMVSSLRMTGDPPDRRSLQATLRVPSDRLDKALIEVRKIGRVGQESQSSEDIADAHRDLVVRIDNATKEEARLNEILVNRTGRLQDVLAVEQEVTRVRGQIEQMKAQELAMRNRVTYATISVEISEAYRAEVTLGPQPIGSRLRNALVDGWRTAASGVFEAVLVLLQVGPSVLAWMVIFGTVPALWLWRRARRTV